MRQASTRASYLSDASARYQLSSLASLTLQARLVYIASECGGEEGPFLSPLLSPLGRLLHKLFIHNNILFTKKLVVDTSATLSYFGRKQPFL